MNLLRILCPLYFISYHLFCVKSKSVYKRASAAVQGIDRRRYASTHLRAEDFSDRHFKRKRSQVNKSFLENFTGKICNLDPNSE